MLSFRWLHRITDGIDPSTGASFHVYWPAIIVWGVWLAYFCFFEFGALISGNDKATLSDNWWALEKLSLTRPFQITPVHVAMAIFIWLLFGWLSGHLPFGWWR